MTTFTEIETRTTEILRRIDSLYAELTYCLPAGSPDWLRVSAQIDAGWAEWRKVDAEWLALKTGEAS